MGSPVDGQTETQLTVSGKTVTYRFLSDEEILKNQERKKAEKGDKKKGGGNDKAGGE